MNAEQETPNCAQRVSTRFVKLAKWGAVAIVGLLMVDGMPPLSQTVGAAEETPAVGTAPQGRGQGRGLGRRYRGGRSQAATPAQPALPGRAEPAPAEPPAAEPADQDDQAPQQTPTERFEEDRDLFHALLSRHDEIHREVENLEDGVRTLTEADDPELAALIKRHVQRMKTRVEDPAPIHMRDPLFRALFQKYEQITMTVEETEKGVRVTERSDDPYVARLIQAHAAVVNLFVQNGHTEVRQNHDVPSPE